MPVRDQRWRALSWLGTTLAFAAGSMALVALNGPAEFESTASWHGWRESVTWLVPMLIVAGLGALIMRRRPDNRMGRVFAAGALLGVTSLLFDQYSGYAMVTSGGSAPGGVPARLASHVAFCATWVVAGVLVPNLFPTGTLLTRRWRLPVWVGIAGGIGFAMMILRPDAFTDGGLLGDVPGARSPLAVPASLAGPLVAATDFGVLGLFFGSLGGVVALVVRAVRSRGTVRQQIKVVAYTTAVAVVVMLVLANTAQLWSGVPAVNLVLNALLDYTFLAIPVSLGLAVLRYRLYEIDRVISRTVSYAILTGLLFALYAGAVFVLSTVLGPLASGSEVAVAGATLVVASVVRPARRRIQAAIDRRFDRARYDATRTIEAFGARLREQTDLDLLAEELRGVVASTMRPAHVSLWVPQQPPR